MMKIRILTRCSGYNFGSSLQAYAIQQVIERLGYKNLIVNYDESFHNLRWKIRPVCEKCIYTFLMFIPMFRAFYKKLAVRSMQRSKFKKFDVLLKKTGKRCRTASDLKREMNDSYACICGSDQIWSPLLMDKNYYLPFITNISTRKIAYAPSLGISQDNQCTSEMIELITHFDYISIREKIGCDIVQRLSNKNVEHVLDPTLLLTSDNWNKISTPYHIPHKYILCYFLGNSNIPTQFIDSLKRTTDIPIVMLQAYDHTCQYQDCKYVYDAGPCEFLSLISNANYICTDSFHGVAFSIIYRKTFFVFNRFKGSLSTDQNSRIDSLLSVLELRGRHKTNNSKLTMDDLMPIEYNEQLLNQYRTISEDFLKKALL